MLGNPFDIAVENITECSVPVASVMLVGAVVAAVAGLWRGAVLGGPIDIAVENLTECPVAVASVMLEATVVPAVTGL